jgi:HPt (histidine-containing phosphotransfer) domain-containing protein
VNDVFESQLATLRRRFVDRAMTQSRTLEGIVSDLEKGASALAFEAGVREIAHSLAGAGGTFGFSRLSALATSLMESHETPYSAPKLISACRALVTEIMGLSFTQRDLIDGS